MFYVNSHQYISDLMRHQRWSLDSSIFYVKPSNSSYANGEKILTVFLYTLVSEPAYAYLNRSHETTSLTIQHLSVEIKS